MRFVNKSKGILNFQGRLIDPGSKIFISEDSVVKYQSLIYKYYSEGSAVIEDFDGKELSIADIREIISKRVVEPVKANHQQPEYLKIANEVNAQTDTETESQAETEAETESETETQADAQTQAETQTDTETESQAETEAETESETETQADAQTQAETQTDTETESQAEVTTPENTKKRTTKRRNTKK